MENNVHDELKKLGVDLPSFQDHNRDQKELQFYFEQLPDRVLQKIKEEASPRIQSRGNTPWSLGIAASLAVLCCIYFVLNYTDNSQTFDQLVELSEDEILDYAMADIGTIEEEWLYELVEDDIDFQEDILEDDLLDDFIQSEYENIDLQDLEGYY